MRRPKRKSRVYRRRRMITRTNYKAGMKPEVKYNTFTTESQNINIAYPGALTTSMYANQFKISNLFGNIAQGTGRGDRIGNKIYVKFIQLTIFARGCPSSADYDVGTFNLRIIVSNTGATRTTAGNIIANYFAPSVNSNFNALINRNAANVRYDKTFLMRADTPTTALVPTCFCGASRRLHITIPIGRVVEFLDGATTVRDDRDFLCLFMMVGVPGMSLATNGYQICCADVISRVYYTDV